MSESLYLDTRQTSEKFGIPYRTLIFWREKRRGPIYYRVDKRVLYNIDEMEQFMASRAVHPKR